jgi:TPP-dependent pyruvate/acetoin dehydrogenase alpha subunit
MGRVTGVCGGRGGSQHLHWRNFYSNGVLGGTVPIATGMAFAEKLKGSGAIAVAFIGDGTLGQGVVYEALNIASLWKSPVLFVLENNHIAQTTDIQFTMAGDICSRFTAFGIPSQQLDTSDVIEISTTAADLLSRVRQEQHPVALVIDTHRFGPHSKGDDTRDPKLLQQMRLDHDPLKIHGCRLDDAVKADIESIVDREIQTAFDQAQSDPFPE